MHATHFAPSGLSLRLRIAMISAQRVHSEWLTGTLTAAQLKQTWRLGGSIDGFFFFHLLPRLLDPVLCSASFCYLHTAPNSQPSLTRILPGGSRRQVSYRGDGAALEAGEGRTPRIRREATSGEGRMAPIWRQAGEGRSGVGGWASRGGARRGRGRGQEEGSRF